MCGDQYMSIIPRILLKMFSCLYIAPDFWKCFFSLYSIHWYINLQLILEKTNQLIFQIFVDHINLVLYHVIYELSLSLRYIFSHPSNVPSFINLFTQESTNFLILFSLYISDKEKSTSCEVYFINTSLKYILGFDEGIKN